MKRKFTLPKRVIGFNFMRSSAFWSLNTVAATAATVIFTMTLSSAAPIQTSGSQTVTGNGGAINGQGAAGYFVQGGTLTINDATLTNFKTTGGAGSGGGAALGGAIFLNSGATVVLNNVNFTNNAVNGSDDPEKCCAH